MSRIRTDSVGEEDQGHAPVVRSQHSVERAANEAAGQRYKQITDFVYLGDAVSESADLNTKIKRRIGAAWASVRYTVPNRTTDGTPGCFCKIGVFKAKVVVEAMLYGWVTETMHSQAFGSLRTVHHNLRLRVIGFWCKDRTRYKPLSYRKALERTGSERIKTTIQKCQLGFAGAFIRQGNSRLSKQVVFEWLTVQESKRGGRSATPSGDCLQKNLEAYGAIQCKDKGRKWVALGGVLRIDGNG